MKDIVPLISLPKIPCSKQAEVSCSETQGTLLYSLCHERPASAANQDHSEMTLTQSCLTSDSLAGHRSAASGSLCPDTATTALFISPCLVSVWAGHKQGEQSVLGPFCPHEETRMDQKAFREPWCYGGKLSLTTSEQCGSRALASLELETLQIDVCSMLEQRLHSL